MSPDRRETRSLVYWYFVLQVYFTESRQEAENTGHRDAHHTQVIYRAD